MILATSNQKLITNDSCMKLTDGSNSLTTTNGVSL